MFSDILKEIKSLVKPTDIRFFRGHSDPVWRLLPRIGRETGRDPNYREEFLYHRYRTLSGPLLPKDINAWDVLLSMQHHGLPTRLLDWSDNFAVALYFALKGAKEKAIVWVLDPFKLHESMGGNRDGVPVDFPETYEKLFWEKATPFPGKVLPVIPRRHHPRVQSQKGCFTIHFDLFEPLESVCPAALKKIEIFSDMFDDAKIFLQASGISEFSLFPDLDGLARSIQMIWP